MYIRQTRTNNKATGEGYFTYRLVRGERVGGKVRQITVLNLGRNFAIKQEDWPQLCARIEHLLHPQDTLLAVACPAHIERAAQRYVGQLVARAPQQDNESCVTGAATPAATSTEPRSLPDFQEVDINSQQLTQPRSVGVEQAGLRALEQLGFVGKLTELGVNGVMRAAILGTLIGRMAKPASELSTWNWLQTQSALGELIDVDFETLSHMTLYRASDILMHHRAAIEDHLFGSIRTLFALEETVTLYDLTNTYFEGAAAANPKAKRGRSKEKRRDCPLVTLGLVLDGSGFVRRSKTFAGNVSEGNTLEVMLTGLSALPGALVIMDAGIATEANLAWLVARGYRYLVVRRGGTRQFDTARAVSIETAGGEALQLQKEMSEDGKEVRLYCHSAGRELKETALTWEKMPVVGTMATHPGVYCLRSSETEWDEERLWRTYTMLTDLESVFRSLKSELGLRPVFHSKEERSDGHLFITVLAYQCVQVLRVQLKAAGITGSWATLRDILSVQRRVTSSFRQRDGHSLNVRKSTLAEPDLLAIYRAIGANPAPGGTRKLIS